MQKRRIAVLFGGQSGEHEVSLVSAQAVIAGLDPQRYEVLPIGIGKDGRWIAGLGAMQALLEVADHTKLPPMESPQPDTPGQSEAAGLLTVARAETLALGAQFAALGTIDVVFPVLHGPLGEDGTVQGLLELAGLPYVGCGVAASAVGMDKALMKAAFAAAGLPLLPWLLVRRSDWRRDPERIYAQIEAALRYPLFVKPANMGSSVGISKAKEREGLAAALAEAARYDARIVIEQGIPAREIEISVLGNDEPEASVPGEVIPSGEWYDYTAKYLSGASQILIPAPLDEQLAGQVRELALRAFVSISGAGLARVDFLLDKESGTLYLNEVNTMPGFTPISMYAKMWAASGLSYPDLLNRLIELAIERHTGYQ